MKNWILIPLFLLFIISCKEEKSDTYLTPEKAISYFKGIEDICNADNGRLWGKNLYGPIMFVDRKSRRIIANKPDEQGLLKSKNGVYSGVYPKELILVLAPVTYGGTQFAMIPISKDEDDYRINTMAIHSLFHLYRKTSGVVSSSYNTNNMDEKEARLWIKLEWKALRKAISVEGPERQLFIRDALIFRGANRELYQKFADDENRFENHEGLATFTYTILCTNSCEEFKEKLFQHLNRIYGMQSFARSYGVVHGALYASLLYDKGYVLHSIQSESFDLGNAVKEQYNIELPGICRDVAGSLAFNYDVDNINKEEEKRFSDIQESINKQISLFTEKPVVFLELESPYFDFEPEDIHSLDTLGTLYNSIRISDNWGKLTVDKGGCLVSNNFKYLRIPAKGFQSGNKRVSGEGWHLILTNDWEIIVIGQNYMLRKMVP